MGAFIRMYPAWTSLPLVLQEFDTVAHTLFFRIACFVSSFVSQVTGVLFGGESKSEGKDERLCGSDIRDFGRYIIGERCGGQ